MSSMWTTTVLSAELTLSNGLKPPKAISNVMKNVHHRDEIETCAYIVGNVAQADGKEKPKLVSIGRIVYLSRDYETKAKTRAKEYENRFKLKGRLMIRNGTPSSKKAAYCCT